MELLNKHTTRNLPESHRLISLLCASYKLFERMILSRITPIVKKVLPIEQAGFRSGRSTTDKVALLTQKIEESYELRRITGAVFLDLPAAFDTVWLKCLELKLHRAISSTKLINLIMSVL